MRLILAWIDQLRHTTAEQLQSFTAALVSQLQEITIAANVWAQKDHHDDGTHEVVRIGLHTATSAPAATPDRISLYWNGTNLVWKKPDGTTGNLV